MNVKIIYLKNVFLFLLNFFLITIKVTSQGFEYFDNLEIDFSKVKK